MQATTCSKYVPRRGVDSRDEQLVRQWAAPIVTEKPQAPKIRAELEPPTTNMTLYGVSRDPANPAPGDPVTFQPRDWKSVTKSHYPEKKPDGYIGKELQIERANFLRTSNWGIGNPDQPPLRVTQFQDDFQKYGRDRYANRTTFNIGSSGAKKVHSDVEIVGAEPAPQPYESMLLRQFQKIRIDRDAATKEAEQRKTNKADMLRSHFVVGMDRVEYKPVASTPLPTTHPKIKNRPPSAVPEEKNPHVCKSAADARPDSALLKAAFLAKNVSHVPVLQPGGSLAGVTTTTSQALPTFAKHREQRAGHAGTTFGSSLNLGNGETNYVTMTRSQFRGIYYK